MPVTNGVAVVADNFWRAKEALHAMPIEWDFGPAGSTDSAQFAAEYRAALDGPLADGGGHGDIDAAFAQPAKVVEALYEVPYLAHAPMEPLNATAHWREDRIDVWMGTQAPESALAFAAKAGGVDPKAVFVHNCFLGGGFGRRAVNDELTQAVEVSKGAQAADQGDLDARRGHPLRPLSPAGGAAHAGRSARRRRARRASTSPPRSARSRARSAGKASRTGSSARRSRGFPTVPIAATRSRSASTSRTPMCRSCSGARSARRRTPSRSRASSTNAPMRPSAIRSNTGARCSWASQTSSPCSTRSRRRATGESRCQKASAAASRSTRRSAPSSARSPRSRSRSSGEVKVQRVVACVDCGHLVNPLTAAMQIESAVLYGLTAALFGEITIKQGPGRAGQFRRLSDRPHGRCTGDRDPLRAVRRRQMGRSRRAGHAADRARDRQRRVRGHGKTRPIAAAQERVARGVNEPTACARGHVARELRYARFDKLIGAPGRVRTANPRFRRPILYPVELRALEARPP